MTEAAAEHMLTRKDFVSDQDVRWCPGCGDYAIVKAVRNALAQLNVSKEITMGETLKNTRGKRRPKGGKNNLTTAAPEICSSLF